MVSVEVYVLVLFGAIPGRTGLLQVCSVDLDVDLDGGAPHGSGGDWFVPQC